MTPQEMRKMPRDDTRQKEILIKRHRAEEAASPARLWRQAPWGEADPAR